MKWEADSGRLGTATGSFWWRRVNRRIVQSALSAWYSFDGFASYPTLSRQAASWYRYIRNRDPGSALRRPGYYGGSLPQAWYAHQHSLWAGVSEARKLLLLEPGPERMLVWKVLNNVEWYYRTGVYADWALWLARRTALYPDWYPTRSYWESCRIGVKNDYQRYVNWFVPEPDWRRC